MKFSTGSSSSSLASDSLSRKSTLCIYTDSDFLNGPEKMDAGNGEELKRELANVHKALRLQSAALVRQQQRSGELALRLASQNAVSARRIQARDHQLTALLRALLILEAKLKSEQKRIQQQVQIKNNRIAQQDEQIKKLRHDLGRNLCKNCRNTIGSTSEHTNVETDPEFHSLESIDSHKNKFERSLSYHEKQQPFQKNSRLSMSFQLPKTENGNGNTSSSEEVFENGDPSKGTFVKNKQAFVRKDITRRSRKYSAHRHLYSDSAQKRQEQASSSSAEDAPETKPSYDIGEQISKDIERASNRIDELLNATDVKSLSSKIDTLHGIKPKNDDRPWYTNSDPEHDVEYKFNRYKCKSADDILTATFNKDKIPSEYLPDADATKRAADYKNYNRFDSDGCENWYASASDQDDEHSCGIYKNNPVLECVNQILLQNNLDESGAVETSPKTNSKRVQFSTLNSISFEEPVKAEQIVQKPIDKRGANKIVKFSLETASEHSYEVPISSEGFNYEVQSVYSNDYEPIDSKPIPKPRSSIDAPKMSVKSMAMNLENKLNHYVDMEAKFSQKRKVPRTPPALPPKPKNLVPKLKLNSNSDSVDNQRHTDVPKTESEPDYCSISEVNVPVKTTAQIHAERRPTIVAKIATISKITNKDIPKLPQVTEIIIPDDDDDSKSKLKPNDGHSIKIGHSVSSILNDIKIRDEKRLQYYHKPKTPEKPKLEITALDSDEKFDLSQNFEEFKIDDEFAEEYKIDDDPKPSKMSNKPDLLSNIDNVETDSVRYSDIESSNSSSSNCGSYNTVKCEPLKSASIPFEYFLESSGLSNKSIITPTRPPNSNHKNVLKPKDIKMRSKNVTAVGRATPLYEKCPNTAIKYFEPYL